MLQPYQASVLQAGKLHVGFFPPLGPARQARGALAAVHLQRFKKLVGLLQLVLTPILLAGSQPSSMPGTWLLRAAHRSVLQPPCICFRALILESASLNVMSAEGTLRVMLSWQMLDCLLWYRVCGNIQSSKTL